MKGRLRPWEWARLRPGTATVYAAAIGAAALIPVLGSAAVVGAVCLGLSAGVVHLIALPETHGEKRAYSNAREAMIERREYPRKPGVRILATPEGNEVRVQAWRKDSAGELSYHARRFHAEHEAEACYEWVSTLRSIEETGPAPEALVLAQAINGRS